MDSNSQLMQVKLEIVQTTNTRGWQLIQKLGEETVKNMERMAIDEEDDVKGTLLRREAKAARKFFTDFTARINLARQVSDEPNKDDFLEICM
jgi:hypothetical protein